MKNKLAKVIETAGYYALYGLFVLLRVPKDCPHCRQRVCICDRFIKYL